MLRDLLVNILRTAIPGWWAALVAFLAAKGLVTGDTVDLASNFGATVVLPAVLALVYALCHLAELALLKVPAAVSGKPYASVATAAAKVLNVLLMGAPRTMLVP